MSRPIRTVLTAAVVSGALVHAAAPTAAADSIAYVQGGDVWLTTSDGSRQFRVTSDGGYASVSQSDAGTLVALRGDRIRTLDRDGTVRHDILTAHSSSVPGSRFRGPFDPTISPDGERIAYSWYFTQTGESGTCNPSTGCQTVYGRQGTNYVSPDGRSPFDRPGYNEQTGWVGPSWTGNGETIISDPIQVGNADVVVHTPGDATSGGGIPGAVSPWFSDRTAAGGLADGELSADRTKLAFVTGPQHETLFLYRGRGGHPTVPENCYRLDGASGRVSSPSWSPDGTSLAYADGAGLNVLPLPSFAHDCGAPTAEHVKRLIVPGATSPDWGPADVPPARVPPPASGGAAPPASSAAPSASTAVASVPAGSGGGGTAGGAPRRVPSSTGVPRAAALTLPRPVALGRALSRGLPVRVSGVRPGSLTVRGVVRGRTMATARVRVGATGSATVTLRFTRAARAHLRSRASVTMQLRARDLRTTVTLRRRAGS